MSAWSPVALRWAVRTLQAAMMTQILLGVTRFVLPFLGRNLPESVWRIHPVLGALIAVAAMIVLRPRVDGAPTASRRIARYAPLTPLALGVAIAIGVAPRLGGGLVALHMIIGLAALGVVDNALKHLLVAGPPPDSRSSVDNHDPGHPPFKKGGGMVFTDRARRPSTR